MFLNLRSSLFTTVIYLATKIIVSHSYQYETLFFTQKVDHFGYQTNDKFSQRYLLENQYWVPDGPIFFYTGNEGDITMFANNTGFMWEIAPKFKAMLVFAEHRYYGVSMPYGMKSFSSPRHRGYLTTEQALADFAVLIYHLKATIPHAENSPVIAFGGSYGGMLAAWMRMKYPHIVDGALSSSAPVLQFSGITPCNKFSEVVTRDFQLEGSACVNSIRNSWKSVRRLGLTEAGVQWLSSNFHLCDKLSLNDTDSLVEWISETWNFLAMTNYPYPTKFLVPLPANPIKEVCKYLTDETLPDEQLLLNIYKAVSVFQNYSGETPCFNVSQSGGSTLGTDTWDYQSCTEMVMPMCSDGVNDMFEPSPWNFSDFSKECLIKFEVQPEEFKAVIMYGGQNISAASNIIFSNGKLDPWSAGGILKSISNTLIAIQIDDAAHHLDLRASNAADPPSVLKAREAETWIIAQWIKQPKNR